MNEKHTVDERWRKILEDNGGVIADKARTILLDDPALRDLRAPLEFVSENWRDPLTPAMMGLSCQAVGGKLDETCKPALAMSLMHLSFYIWDDIIDKVAFKSFKPTLFGKFGSSTALIIGGLTSAKAFSVLNEMNINKAKKETVVQLFWELWAKMAQAEMSNLRLRSQKKHSSHNKFRRIRIEAMADMGACLRIGAVLGGGSHSEIAHLGKYGYHLGIILELWKDFHVSVNLTSGLASRIRSGMYPYFLLWAMERSEKLQKNMQAVTNENKVDPSVIQEIVENILETEALDNAVKTINGLSKKAKKELTMLKQNKATILLKFFIEVQSQLFIDSFSALKA